MRLVRLLAVVAAVVVAAAVAPSAFAWDPRWIPVGPVTVTVNGAPFLPPVGQPLPVVVSTYVLPPLQQFLPPMALQQAPLQVARLPGGQMALSHPLLFCSLDQAATCEELAQQLAAVTPGWSTTTMSGPQGYGVYLTYQPSSAPGAAPPAPQPPAPQPPFLPPNPFSSGY